MKYLKYVIIFIVFFYVLLIPYNMYFGDTIVNYGFSYALSIGEIPYKDFNLIIPLFSPFIYSIVLLVNKSIISIFLLQSLFLTMLFNLMEKKLNNKIYLLFLLILFNYPIGLVSFLFPGYNFLLYLLLFLIIYLEEYNKDYLIGLLIGLAIITKHTIGIFFIIPSIIFYYKDYRKLLTRFITMLIPIFIFFIYLIITKSLNNFVNLCILGLFDFASNNNHINYLLLGIALLCLLYFIYIIIIDRKNISNYYLLLSLLFIIPLVDQYHLSYLVISTLFIFINRLNIEKYYKSFIIIDLIIICLWTFIAFNYNDFRFVSYNNYPLRYLSNSWKSNYDGIDKFIKKNDNTVLFLLGTENYFYKITNNMKISYFDLPNYGNYGYDGYSTMKGKIDNLDNTYFIINKSAFVNKSFNQQYYKELVDYITKFKFVKKINNYEIYYKE